MDEMPARPHPDLRAPFQAEVRQPIRRDQAAIGDATGEMRRIRPE